MPLDLSAIMSVLGGGGPPGPGMLPPTGPPPLPGASPGPPGANLPQIPTGGSGEMVSQVQSIGTQVAQIGAQFMSRGQHDAAIACAKAVKELEKVPELLQRGQQIGPPPDMGVSGIGMAPPSMPPMGPPPMPGM